MAYRLFSLVLITIIVKCPQLTKNKFQRNDTYHETIGDSRERDRRSTMKRTECERNNIDIFIYSLKLLRLKLCSDFFGFQLIIIIQSLKNGMFHHSTTYTSSMNIPRSVSYEANSTAVCPQ